MVTSTKTDYRTARSLSMQRTRDDIADQIKVARRYVRELGIFGAFQAGAKFTFSEDYAERFGDGPTQDQVRRIRREFVMRLPL